MKLRPTQVEAIDKALDAIDAGKTDIFIEAPTGTGKSVIALELAKRLGPGYICTHEKMLQAQYENDIREKFSAEYAKDSVSLSGNDTYFCEVNGEPFSLGACKSMGMSNAEARRSLSCAASCEYLLRQSKARNARIAILNYSYFLVQLNYVFTRNKHFAPFKPRNVLICDEAHKLPDIVESHFAAKVSLKTLNTLERLNAITPSDQFYVSPTRLKASIVDLLKLSNIDGKSAIFSAMQNFYKELSIVSDALNNSKTHFIEAFGFKTKTGSSGSVDVAQLASDYAKLPAWVKGIFRAADFYKDVACKFEDSISNIMRDGLFNLVVDIQPGEKTFHNFADDKLFRSHVRPFAKIRIYMSATLNADLMIERFKLDRNKCEIVSVNPNWKPENSPIFLVPSGNFSHASLKKELPKMCQNLDKILDSHKNERGVIHTTTYSITDYLLKNSRHKKRFLVYKNVSEKIELLKSLSQKNKSSILIGPSLTTGVDLYDDFGRFNIICKISYPFVGNALWNARFKYKKKIYFYEAALTLEQAAGRTTRNDKDFSKTYILDSRAKNFISRCRSYFSESFLKRLS